MGLVILCLFFCVLAAFATHIYRRNLDVPRLRNGGRVGPTYWGVYADSPREEVLENEGVTCKVPSKPVETSVGFIK